MALLRNAVCVVGGDTGHCIWPSLFGNACRRHIWPDGPSEERSLSHGRPLYQRFSIDIVLRSPRALTTYKRGGQADPSILEIGRRHSFRRRSPAGGGSPMSGAGNFFVRWRVRLGYPLRGKRFFIFPGHTFQHLAGRPDRRHWPVGARLRGCYIYTSRKSSLSPGPYAYTRKSALSRQRHPPGSWSRTLPTAHGSLP